MDLPVGWLKFWLIVGTVLVLLSGTIVSCDIIETQIRTDTVKALVSQGSAPLEAFCAVHGNQDSARPLCLTVRH